MRTANLTVLTADPVEGRHTALPPREPEVPTVWTRRNGRQRRR
jgi:hypothetical protein